MPSVWIVGICASHYCMVVTSGSCMLAGELSWTWYAYSERICRHYLNLHLFTTLDQYLSNERNRQISEIWDIIWILPMMLRNNSLVLYGVPKLNFKINVIKIRVLNSFFMKSATNLGLFYSFFYEWNISRMPTVSLKIA